MRMFRSRLGVFFSNVVFRTTFLTRVCNNHVLRLNRASFSELPGILAPKPSAISLQPHPEVLPVVRVPVWTRFRPPRDSRHHQFVQGPNPADHSLCPTLLRGCGSGLTRMTWQFRLPSDTPAHGCWHGAWCSNFARSPSICSTSASVW